MRFPLVWAQEWIDLQESPEVIAERLTAAGFEVDEIERTGPDLTGIRVAQVLERADHPNADRLSVCRVDLGEEEPFEVVCGAPNVAAGQKVAFAAPGTTLPDGTRLKKAKIRGVVSHGMILSERELGLGSDQEGILVLATEAPVGEPLASVVSAGDAVLEVAILPNRGDAASMLGIARELQAQFGRALRIPEHVPPEGERASREDLRVEIEDRAGCHRYVARVVRGVRIGPSPGWLVSKLESAGVRPINVVVDITNLVLLEFGQPIHAFDLSTIRGGVIRVRSAAEGEGLQTLDRVERRLSAGDLVIADAERAVAVAGVMGGAETEVGDETADVLIESAHFQPARVRRTARRLGLQTEASYRFERGVDRDEIARAADRAARLLAELAGGDVSKDALDVQGDSPDVTETIMLEVERVNRLLGTSLTTEEIRAALGRVGVQNEVDGDRLRCRIPTYRNDLHRPQDLIEEVARIYGYDRIEPTLPTAQLEGVTLPRVHRLTERARDTLRASGLLEVMSLPFVRETDLDRLRLAAGDARRDVVELLNPIVEGASILQPLLVPSLLEIARQNRSRQVESVRIFEVGRVFGRSEAGELPAEPLHVAAVIVRDERRGLWDGREAPPLFHEVKGIVERLLSDLDASPSFMASPSEPFLHPAAGCGIAAADRTVGFVGEIHPDVAESYELDAPCALFELDLSAVSAFPERVRVFHEVSRHPLVRRDLAVTVDLERPAGELVEAIRKAGGSILVAVDIFDRYVGKGIPEGKVSLAFRLVFQRQDRALTDAEVTKQTDRIVQLLARRFGATLR